MLSHKQVWEGIDRLAAANGLSASGLAKRAGLDPTTFNKSKRITKQGKPRWPSTESLSKILEATSTPMRGFVELIDAAGQGRRASQRIRCVSLTQVEQGGGVDATGFPVGGKLDEIDFPAIDDEHVYIVELDRDLAPPHLRSGDQIVVTPSSGIRRGDRVLARLRNGSVVVGVLARRTAQRINLIELANPSAERAIDGEELAWLARVVWVGQ
jgi:phage repressor protein C with HTH and peptisase S24 domain